MNNEMRIATRVFCKVYPMLLLATVTVLTMLIGCSSEDPNLVGIDLVEAEFDSLLQTVELLVPVRHAHLTVPNAEIPFHKQEVLYFGEHGQESSVILSNYDFSDLEDTLLTDDRVNSGNISSVYFRFYAISIKKIVTGSEIDDDGNEVPVTRNPTKSLEIHQLDAPFDTLDYALYLPAELPNYDETLGSLNTVVEGFALQNTFKLYIRKEAFVTWFDNRQKVGLLFKESDYIDIDSCLVGLASSELDDDDIIDDDQNTDTITGAVMMVEFQDDQVAMIPPSEDVSSLFLNPPPASATEGLLVRTLDRRYPIIDFDLSVLPEDVLINRAVLAVTADISNSYGTPGSLIVSEVDTSLASDLTGPIDIEDLPDKVYQIAGDSSVDPILPDHAYREFNVTASIQRYINQVYNQNPDVMVQRSFLITAGESFFGTDSEGIRGPDYHLRTFKFFGNAEADTALWPKLRITYTRDSSISGGGK